MPANIVELQFMNSAVTGVDNGHQAKNHKGVKNIKAAMLIGKPYFPSDHLRDGKGGPLSLLHIRQPIVM